jgi:hypothetical protein
MEKELKENLVGKDETVSLIIHHVAMVFPGDPDREALMVDQA